MALKAPPGRLVVTPSGDNDESEQGRLIVVENDKPERKIYRGVVLDVGREMDYIVAGDVVHYASYWEIHGKHVVPAESLVAFEDDE